MPPLAARRAGERVVVKGRELEFSYWPMYKTTRRYGLHSIIYATNPWAIIESSIQSRCAKTVRPEALGSLSQASYFYEAAQRAGPWAAKPLLLYYSLMNLGKAYCLTEGQSSSFDQAHHGIIERRHKGLDDLNDAFVRVFPKSGQRGLNLFAHFVDALAGHQVPNPVDFDVPKLLPQVVAGHRLWCDAADKTERFIPIKEVQFRKNAAKKNVWVELHVYAQDLTRLGVTHKRFLEGSGLDAQVREVKSTKDGTKKVLRFEQKKPVPYKSRVSDVIPKTVTRIRHSLWAIVRSDPPFRKYYAYVVPTAEKDHVLPQLASIYAVMFYLGSVTRYRPQQFDALLDSDFGPQLQEILTAQPAQFLYLMASEFAQREVTRPAIV